MRQYRPQSSKPVGVGPPTATRSSRLNSISRPNGARSSTADEKRAQLIRRQYFVRRVNDGHGHDLAVAPFVVPAGTYPPHMLCFSGVFLGLLKTIRSLVEGSANATL